MDWLDTLKEMGEPCVLVTVASADGSVPREAGAKMLVTARRTHGTIGGGRLELKSVETARRMLSDPDQPAILFCRISVDTAPGQSSGGEAGLVLERINPPTPEWVTELERRIAAGETLLLATAMGGAAVGRLVSRRDAGCVASVDALPGWLREPARDMLEGGGAAAKLAARRDGDAVLLERMAPSAFQVMLFGAGHVGQALVRVLAQLPCRIVWVDDRESQFPESVPASVTRRFSPRPEAEVDAAPRSGYFLVMTHSHALDERICERIFLRDDFAYFGLIGSKAKRAQLERRLADRGVDPKKFARLICPVGIEGIKGKEPGSIAVAVAAQLLQARDAPALRS